MGSSDVRYIKDNGLGRESLVLLPHDKAPRCPRPVLFRDLGDDTNVFAKPCESFRCPACGPARRAETA